MILIDTEPDLKSFLWDTIKRLDFYINTTNTKATIIIAFNTFTTGSVILKYKDILCLFSNNSDKLKTGSALLLSLSCISSLISLYFIFKVVTPFLDSHKNEKNYLSKLFFIDIAKNSTAQDYLNELKKSNKDSIVEDLATQAFSLAKGTETKFNNIKNSVLAIFFELGFLALVFILKIIDLF